MTSYVITYREIKGSPIVASEYDGSLHNLDDRATALEATASGLSSVVSAEVQTDGHLVFTLSNSDTIDAGDISNFLPSFTDLFIGDWQSSMQVYENQLFTAYGALYVVLRDHVTDSTFDKYANDGAAHDYYEQVLDYTSTAGVEISDTTFSPELTHVGLYIRLTGASCAVTIDPDLDWPDWAELHFYDATTAGATFDISGTTAEPAIINPQHDCQNASDGQGSSIGMKKVGATRNWDIWGRLLAATTA